MGLNDLHRGDCARIVGFDNTPPAYRNRLLSMGLTPGTQISVQHIAPLGDPIALLVRGFTLSLRRQEAATVLVEKL